MDLTEAVEILNDRSHRGTDQWWIATYHGEVRQVRADNTAWVLWDKEVIAIATWYVRIETQADVLPVQPFTPTTEVIKQYLNDHKVDADEEATEPPVKQSFDSDIVAMDNLLYDTWGPPTVEVTIGSDITEIYRRLDVLAARDNEVESLVDKLGDRIDLLSSRVDLLADERPQCRARAAAISKQANELQYRVDALREVVIGKCQSSVAVSCDLSSDTYVFDHEE